MNLADVIDDDDSIVLAAFDDDGSFAAGDRFFAIASCVNVRCSKHALSQIQQQSLCFVTTDYTTAIAYCCVCWDVLHHSIALI